MKAKSILIFCVAVALSIVSCGAMAETSCSPDGFGGTTCRDNNGNTTRETPDGFGGTTWRDNNGNTTRCSPDGFGGTKCR